MCVTLTGCELLCCETSDWQQRSHATLKSKLRVQIMMKVMKDRNAKACRGFIWIKPVSAWDGARGCLVFPVDVRKATDQACDSSAARGPRWVTPWVEPGMGPGAACPSLPSVWKERSLGVPGRWIWKPESHPATVYDSGEKPSAGRVSPPGKAKGGSQVRYRAWLKWSRGWTSVRTEFTKTFQNGFLDEWGGLTWTLT